MNWDDDWNKPYRRRNPYGDRWGKWTPKKSSEELNDMIKKAWEKIEQWVPEREPDLTPSWSDIEKLYKHCEKLYKHIAVLHDDIEILKEKVVQFFCISQILNINLLEDVSLYPKKIF